MSQTIFAPAPHATVHRHPDRATYDRAAVHAILDEALYCNVGFVAEGKPFVIPCIHARMGDTIYLHGAVASRLLAVAASGEEICISATLIDGLVLARSWFSHSMNYRSVVVFGRGRVIEDLAEKYRALRVIVEHVAPGRSREARPPSPREMAATAVVAVEIAHGSAKVRRGLPKDQEADHELPVWAGVLPLRTQVLPPVVDPRTDESIRTPDSVTHYGRPGGAGAGRTGR